MILKPLLYLGCPECSGAGFHQGCLCTSLHPSFPNRNQPPSCLPAAEKHPHSIKLPPPCFTLGIVSARWWVVLVSSWHEAWYSFFFFYQIGEFCFPWSKSPSGGFVKLQAYCHVPFSKAWLSSGHSTIWAWLVECCRNDCPFERSSFLHRVKLELWIAHFFPLWMLEPTVLIGTLNTGEFFYTLALICASIQSCLEVYRQFLGFLVCALTWTVHDWILYRQVCPFPSHVQST